MQIQRLNNAEYNAACHAKLDAAAVAEAASAADAAPAASAALPRVETDAAPAVFFSRTSRLPTLHQLCVS
jgi:hypothetical protein